MPEVVGIIDLLNRKLEKHPEYIDGLKIDAHVYNPINITWELSLDLSGPAKDELSQNKARRIAQEVCREALSVVGS